MSNFQSVVKILDSITGRRRIYEVFDDLLTMFAYSFRNSVDKKGWQEREDKYLSIVHKYSSSQLDKFVTAFTLITDELATKPQDVFGKLYMELEISDARSGQFYTPFEVAETVIGIGISNIMEKLESKPFVTVHEPACGAGAFLVALTKELRARGVNPQKRLWVACEDISLEAVKMVYLHLTLLHIPGVVFHRDTLSGETFDTWFTPAHIVDGWDRKLKNSELSASAIKPLPADSARLSSIVEVEPEPVTLSDWDAVFEGIGA